MRHRRKGTRLNRKSNQLKALLRNLVTSLVLNGEMVTTISKAKAIIPVFDRLVVTIRNKDEMNGIRAVQKILFGEKAQKKLVQEIVPALEGRPSGFLSLLKVGARKGDNSPIVRITILTKDAKKDSSPVEGIIDAEIVEKPKKKAVQKSSEKKSEKESKESKKTTKKTAPKTAKKNEKKEESKK